MIEIKCTTQDVIMLNQLVPFQGDLKKRSVRDIKELSKSLLTDGLLMPFVLWNKDDTDGQCCILDGHGRLAALTDLALQDTSISEQAFPCIYVNAATEDDAKKALLQITSQYGKFNRPGVEKFISTLGNYNAPVVKHFTRKAVTQKDAIAGNKRNMYTVVRVSIPADKYEQFKELISGVEYAKFLK